MNGELYPDNEARISIFDHGLVVGDGVFETVKVAGGQAFALTRHLARLGRSAAGLGMSAPDLEQIRAGALAVIDASPPVPLARMRITVTAGIGPLGSERGNSALTAIVALAEQPEERARERRLADLRRLVGASSGQGPAYRCRSSSSGGLCRPHFGFNRTAGSRSGLGRHRRAICARAGEAWGAQGL